MKDVGQSAGIDRGEGLTAADLGDAFEPRQVGTVVRAVEAQAGPSRSRAARRSVRASFAADSGAIGLETAGSSMPSVNKMSTRLCAETFIKALSPLTIACPRFVPSSSAGTIRSERTVSIRRR